MHNIFKLSIEKTFLIASLPFIGYLLAYIFQYTYYSYFNVPSLFIRIGIEDVIKAVIPVIGLSALILIIISIVSNSSSNQPATTVSKSTNPNDNPGQKLNYWESLFLGVFLTVVICLIIFFAFKLVLIFKIILTLLLSLLVLIPISLVPRFYYRNTSFIEAITIYNEKVKEDNKLLKKEFEEKKKLKEANTKKASVTFIFKPESKVQSYLIYFGTILGLCFMSVLTGLAFAQGTDTFITYTDKQKNKYIILGTYDNNFVSVLLNKTHKFTTKQLKLFHIDNTNISSEYLGQINKPKNSKGTVFISPQNPKITPTKFPTPISTITQTASPSAKSSIIN